MLKQLNSPPFEDGPRDLNKLSFQKQTASDSSAGQEQHNCTIRSWNTAQKLHELSNFFKNMRVE